MRKVNLGALERFIRSGLVLVSVYYKPLHTNVLREEATAVAFLTSSHS